MSPVALAVLSESSVVQVWFRRQAREENTPNDGDSAPLVKELPG